MPKRPVFYAMKGDLVGSVRVFKCPICHDGEIIEAMREALAWYACDAIYTDPDLGQQYIRHDIINDNGQRARDALKKLRGEV